MTPFQRYCKERSEACGERPPAQLRALPGYEHCSESGVKSIHEIMVTITEGGAVTSPDQLQWSVAIEFGIGSIFELAGAGSIILPDVVLTALHVVNQQNFDHYVRVGNHSLKSAHSIPVRYFCATPQMSAFDLALLKLDGNALDCQSTAVIPLTGEPYFQMVMDKPVTGLVGGWGLTTRESASWSDELIDIAVTAGKYHARDDFPDGSLFELDSECGGGPCMADSGAGLVVPNEDGHPVIAGVCSRIAYGPYPNCHSNANPMLMANTSALCEMIMDLANSISEIQ